MPKCIIDGKEVEFAPGENLITVAKRAGTEIPVFCYHPGLTVVAQCRMCYVEVEKMPKLQTACSTMAAEGMVVKTQSEAVKKGRAGTMEFLLLNHPLDCPICDKSGECDLQDNSYAYGNSDMRHSEERRTYVDVDMGPVIQKNMNRCIHCTRCMRFGEEVAGIHEMIAVKRGNNIDISTIDGLPLKSEYAGNYSDICPTGSLTLRDFRFKKRAWMLKKTASVCEGCSKGCNMEIQHEGNVVYRSVPIENMKINRYWMCDEGRFNYNYTQSENRIIQPIQSGQTIATWDAIVAELYQSLNNSDVTFLIGSDLTNEEIESIQSFAKEFLSKAKLFHFGTADVTTTVQDGPADKILKMKSKTSNLNGIEKLGIKPYTNEKLQTVVLFRGGRAQLPDLSAAASVFAVGVFQKTEVMKNWRAVMPGLAFTEKSGTIINHQGIAQKLNRAVQHKLSCKSISEVLMLLANQVRKGQGAA
jgi:NADH-quinone oxidoreductase subunit G